MEPFREWESSLLTPLLLDIDRGEPKACSELCFWWCSPQGPLVGETERPSSVLVAGEKCPSELEEDHRSEGELSELSGCGCED